MARPIWSGTISFGLVSIPVKLFNAVSRKSVSFNQLDVRSGSRIRLKKVSALDGSDVPEDQIVKGYEVSKDRYVTIEPEELAAFDPVADRTIELDDFVDLAEIDPIYYDSPYYLVPDKGAAKPYALLSRAMEDAGKVGIARFVMRTKQYLAAIRVAEGHLVLSTMVYDDEVVEPASIEGLVAADEVELSDRELTMARQLVDSLSAPFEPDRYQDDYRHRVMELIDRKAAGEKIEAPTPSAAPSKVIDLMAALEASVREAKAARGRHPAGVGGVPRVGADDAAPAAAGGPDGDGEEAGGTDGDAGSNGGSLRRQGPRAKPGGAGVGAKAPARAAKAKPASAEGKVGGAKAAAPRKRKSA